jgi:hypothetical protein
MTPPLRKYLHAVLLLAILPAALMLAWQAWSGIRAQEDQVQAELDRAASAFAQSADRELASSIDALTVLSQSELFQQGRIAAMGRLLRGSPRRDWDSVFLMDASGTAVLDTAPRGHSLPLQAMRELRAQALRKAGPVVSGTTGSPGIAIAVPIAQPGGVRYVLGVRTSDAMWARLAASAPLPPDGQASLYDEQGHPIAGVATDAAGDDTYESWAVVPLGAWRARVSLPAAPIAAQHRAAIVAALSTSGAALLIGFVLAALAAGRLVRDVELQARAKDEQLSRLVHDARNVLNAIATAADVLETSEPGSEAAAEGRSIISRQTRALANLLQDRGKPRS